MKFKNAIVITGGIATGKSLVCDILKSKNFKIIDADEISHQILDTLTDEISKIFGNEFIKDGKVDRKKLGDLVFNDKSKLKTLESLLHPKIRADGGGYSDTRPSDRDGAGSPPICSAS